MNQRISLLLVCVIGSGSSILAQTDTSQAANEQATFAMTKATLEFLATDAKTYGYNKTPCQPCATYADLRQFVQKNNLTRANELITDVQKQATTASAADLRTYLLRRVTEGADHTHRTRLASFVNYQQALNAAVGDTPAPTDATQTGDPDAPAGDTAVVDSPISTDQDVANQSDVSVNSQPKSSMFSWLSLVLSLLSLAGVVFLFFRQNQNRPGPAIDVDKEVLDEMSRRISDLERSRDELFNRVVMLEKAGQSTRATPVSQSQMRAAQPAPTPPPAQAPIPPTVQTPWEETVVPPAVPVTPAPPANTPRSPQPTTPTLFYGRTADLGDGFSVGGLSTKPDRDTVFEILRIDTGRAEFQVSDNPDLQRLALSDPYSYLNDTCTYATQPRPGSRIRTERRGTLSLQGEKWVITEKAQISFMG